MMKELLLYLIDVIGFLMFLVLYPLMFLVLNPIIIIVMAISEKSRINKL